jgi:hypothetical protein
MMKIRAMPSVRVMSASIGQAAVDVKRPVVARFLISIWRRTRRLRLPQSAAERLECRALPAA